MLQLTQDQQKLLLLVVGAFLVWYFFLKERFVTGYAKTWKPSPRSKPADYPLAGESWFMSESDPNRSPRGLASHPEFY